MSQSAAPIRLALLGSGAIAQVAHLPILSRMRGVEVAAVCDPDQRKAHSIAQRFGVERVCASADELWKHDDVDGVIVCTPNRLHADQVRAALEADKYVLCEKPLALNAEQAERVVGTPGAERRLMVGMNLRYRPDAEALRRFIVGGELGESFYVRAGWLNRRIGQSRRTWRHEKRGAGGGVLMDLGIQMLDLALWLMGYPRPRAVIARMHRSPGEEVEDLAVLGVDLEGERTLTLEVTWNLHAERERQYLEVLGSSGSASLQPLKVFKELDGVLHDLTPELAPGKENAYTASYRQQLSAFAALIRGEREPDPPTEQVSLLRVIDAAYRSAAERTEIRL